LRKPLPYLEPIYKKLLIMIKRYLQFIKEQQLSPMEEVMRPVEEVKTYRLEDDKIEELFVEMKDAGYTINIERGFVEEQLSWNHNSSKVFGQKLIKGEVTPAYWVKIYDEKPSSDDVTDVVLTAIDYFEDLGFDVKLYEDKSEINVDELLVKGGFFLKDEDDENIHIEDNIGIFVMDKKEVNIDSKELCEYYGWLSEKDKDTFIEGNDIYIVVGMEDLVDILLGSKDKSLKNQLINGIDGYHYWGSDYYPETNSLFNYDLNKENEVLTIKALIKEYGGLEELVKEADNDKLEGLTEDEVIEYLLKERFYSTLTDLCKDSDLIQDIKQTYADYALNAHQEENYKELVNEFDNIVGDRSYGAELSYSKYDKEVEVKKSYTKEDGTRETHTYPEVQTFYKIKYDNNWIENFDYDFLENESLYYVFREYCQAWLGTFEFEPHFSDYGSVDSKEFNSDVTWMLNNKLGIENKKNPS
jgi:hypothetical protein